MSFDLNDNSQENINTSEIEQRTNAERVLAYADRKLREIAPIHLRLLQARHELFELINSHFESNLPIEDQLYEDHSYNDAFVTKDLRVRTGSEYHNETESYDEKADDTPEVKQQKYAFRQSILGAAQTLGYVSAQPGQSTDELDRKLNIQESTLEKISSPVEAVVIPGAAALSNHIRIADTLRNIESGAINTDRIIFVAGERIAPEAEQNKVINAGYRAGANEFDAAIAAFEDLTGIAFSENTETLPAQYGTDTPDTKLRHGTITVGDQLVEVTVLEAAYDRNRVDGQSGKPANRAITEETYAAALPLLKNQAGTVVIESHDTWQKDQEVTAELVFGLEAGKTVIGTGAYKDDRVVEKGGKIDITLAQGVIDEIAKTHRDLVRLRIAAENKLQ